MYHDRVIVIGDIGIDDRTRLIMAERVGDKVLEDTFELRMVKTEGNAVFGQVGFKFKACKIEFFILHCEIFAEILADIAVFHFKAETRVFEF